MASNPQKSKSLEGVLSKMDIAIQRLRSAWNACDVVPARIALGSAFVLLSIIRVRFLRFFDERLRTHVYPGHLGQQTGVYRTRTGLRRSV